MNSACSVTHFGAIRVESKPGELAVHDVMPKKLVMPSTGTRVIFGA